MQLIMIEGLPGTGKSTVTGWLNECLNACGKNATPFFEGDARIPCDFYDTAGIPLNDFQAICNENCEFAEALKKNALATKNYVFLRIEDYPENIIKLLRCWDMGDESNQKITVSDYIPCSIERLKFWVQNMAHEFDIVIVDSGFLQNPINELLFRKATDDEVFYSIKKIFDTIKDLDPLCVYLCRSSAEEAINFAKKVKGKVWADRIDSLLNETDCKNLFQHRFKLEKQLIHFIPNVVCEVNEDDWSLAKERIKNYFLL